MSKNSSIKTFFQALREKKQIEIQDIDDIAVLFVSFYNLAKKQYGAALEIHDKMQRISMLIICLENLAKPIAITEALPPPLQKWIVSEKEFKSNIVLAGTSHEFKQKVMTQYGKVVGILGYKHWIPNHDVDMLQIIKERAQHGDTTFPFTDKQAERLCKKMEKFLEERFTSLYMYHSEKAAKEFVRRLSLLRNFIFPDDQQEFIMSITDEFKTYEDLCQAAIKFKPSKKPMNVKMFAVIVADKMEDFTKKMKEVTDEHFFQERVYQTKSAKITREYAEKYMQFKKIISYNL